MCEVAAWRPSARKAAPPSSRQLGGVSTVRYNPALDGLRAVAVLIVSSPFLVAPWRMDRRRRFLRSQRLPDNLDPRQRVASNRLAGRHWETSISAAHFG
jgi:hypothetical protein